MISAANALTDNGDTLAAAPAARAATAAANISAAWADDAVVATIGKKGALHVLHHGRIVQQQLKHLEASGQHLDFITALEGCTQGHQVEHQLHHTAGIHPCWKA